MAALLVLALGAIPFHGLILRTLAPTPAVEPVTPPHPDGWRRFQAPDGTFEVIGPATPTVTGISTELGAAHEASFSDGLRVVWADAPVSEAPDRQILADVWSRSIRPLVGLTADEEADLVDDGHPGLGISLTSEGNHLAMRVFVAGGRFFEVVGVGPGNGENGESSNAEAFVRSFVLDL
jgi:hypothetical protein